jgi:hypothetical protein
VPTQLFSLPVGAILVPGTHPTRTRSSRQAIARERDAQSVGLSGCDFLILN